MGECVLIERMARVQVERLFENLCLTTAARGESRQNIRHGQIERSVGMRETRRNRTQYSARGLATDRDRAIQIRGCERETADVVDRRQDAHVVGPERIERLLEQEVDESPADVER